MSLKQTLTFLLAAALLTACSGPQTGGDGPAERGWNHSFDAIPSDVALAFGYDLDDTDAQILRGGEAPEDASLTTTIFANVVEEMYREADINNAEELGLDPSGDFSFFAWENSIHVVLRATDSQKLVDRFFSEAPSDVEMSEMTIGGHSYRVGEEREVMIYGGALDGFAVFHFIPHALEDHSSLVTRLLTGGSVDEQRFVDSERAARAFAKEGASGEPKSIYFADLAAANALMEFANSVDEANMDEDDRALMGVSEEEISGAEPAETETDAFEERCAEAADSITSRYRWIGGAAYANGSLLDSVARLAMSPGQADRAREVLVGAPTSGDAVYQNAIYGFSFGLDLRMLLDRLPGESELSGCDNIAALRGQLSRMGSFASHEIRRALALVSGSMSLAIFDVDLQGMVPLIDAAVAIKTGQPERLAAQIQDELRSAPDVQMNTIPDTQYPTTEISSPATPISMRLIQGEDRVLIVVGDAPPAAEQAMLDPEQSSEILRAHVNGERAETLMEEMNQYIEDMGGGSAAGGMYPMSFLGDIFGALGTIYSTDIVLTMSDNELVLETNQEPRADEASE
jgi:hypothetical protein